MAAHKLEVLADSPVWPLDAKAKAEALAMAAQLRSIHERLADAIDDAATDDDDSDPVA